MKTWKVFLAVALTTVALLMMSSIVIAAPDSAPVARTSAPAPVLSDTLPLTHPVGLVIALYFSIPYTEVMELHNDGLGFGDIARAYLTAAASGGTLTPEQVLAMRQDGIGWGQIKQDYGIHPGGNGLGSIKGNKVEPPPAPPGNGDPGPGECPGNSCNAPGQQKPPKDKPPKGPKN